MRRSPWRWATSSCKEFHVDRQVTYFDDYCRQYTDMPMLVRLVKQRRHATCPDALLRAVRLRRRAGRDRTIPNGRPSPSTRRQRRASWRRAARSASAGARTASGTSRRRTPPGARPRCGCRSPTSSDDVVDVALPLFRQHRARAFRRDRPSARADAQRAGQEARARRRRDAGRLGLRPVRRQLRRRPRPRRRNVAKSLRRRRALHAGLGREDHRRAARHRSSRWRASSRPTPRRPRAGRWSSSARR